MSTPRTQSTGPVYAGRRARRAACTIALASGALVAFLGQSAYADAYLDTFDSIHGAYWSDRSTGNSSAVGANQLVELTLGATGTAALLFQYPIAADFTAQVDYALRDWPRDARVWIGLGIGDNTAPTVPGEASVQRVSWNLNPGGEFYGMVFSSIGQEPFIPTADNNGRFQIRRQGQTVSGAYWDGSHWVTIASRSHPDHLNSSYLGFGIFPTDPNVFVPNLTAAFDNFSVDAPGTTIPIPEPTIGALSLAGVALIAAVIRVRRRDRKAPITA